MTSSICNRDSGKVLEMIATMMMVLQDIATVSDNINNEQEGPLEVISKRLLIMLVSILHNQALCSTEILRGMPDAEHERSLTVKVPAACWL